MRKALFNLIIYAEEKKRFDRFQKMALDILKTFPIKVVAIEGISSGPFVESSDKGCVSLKVPQKDLSKTLFLVLPHLISDIPTYLVWGEELSLKNSLFASLTKLACRVIFDTKCPSSILQKMADLEYMDINWALLGGWRDLFAQFFDSKERLLLLESADSLSITYQAPTPIRAQYLQAWVASKMGWNSPSCKKEKNNLIFHYKKRQKSTKVSLIPETKKGATPGTILKIECLTETKETLKFVRENSHQIRVYLSTPEICKLPLSFSLPELTKGFPFIKELFYQSCNSQYKNMLKNLSPLEKI